MTPSVTGTTSKPSSAPEACKSERTPWPACITPAWSICPELHRTQGPTDPPLNAACFLASIAMSCTRRSNRVALPALKCPCSYASRITGSLYLTQPAIHLIDRRASRPCISQPSESHNLEGVPLEPSITLARRPLQTCSPSSFGNSPQDDMAANTSIILLRDRVEGSSCHREK